MIRSVRPGTRPQLLELREPPEVPAFLAKKHGAFWPKRWLSWSLVGQNQIFELKFRRFSWDDQEWGVWRYTSLSVGTPFTSVRSTCLPIRKPCLHYWQYHQRLKTGSSTATSLGAHCHIARRVVPCMFASRTAVHPQAGLIWPWKLNKHHQPCNFMYIHYNHTNTHTYSYTYAYKSYKVISIHIYIYTYTFIDAKIIGGKGTWGET